MIRSNLYQYDWKSQSCYLYKEPLLGASGTSGNAITYTAVKMANISNKPIVIIPFGVGGTSILNWAYGDLSHQHKLVMKQVKESGLSPRIFLWHQGESDSQTTSFPLDEITKAPYFQQYYLQKGNRRGMIPLREDVYYNALKKVVESTFKRYPQSSFGIALATICSNRNTQWNPVRSAQKRISRDLPNTFISADSDKITGLDKRPDNCHFSTKGASELGNLYYESIINDLKKDIFIYDPLDALCENNNCSVTDISGKSLYIDQNHITDYANKNYIYPDFINFLQRNNFL